MSSQIPQLKFFVWLNLSLYMMFGCFRIVMRVGINVFNYHRYWTIFFLFIIMGLCNTFLGIYYLWIDDKLYSLSQTQKQGYYDIYILLNMMIVARVTMILIAVSSINELRGNYKQYCREVIPVESIDENKLVTFE